MAPPGAAPGWSGTCPAHPWQSWRRRQRQPRLGWRAAAVPLVQALPLPPLQLASRSRPRARSCWMPAPLPRRRRCAHPRPSCSGHLRWRPPLLPPLPSVAPLCLPAFAAGARATPPLTAGCLPAPAMRHQPRSRPGTTRAMCPCAAHHGRGHAGLYGCHAHAHMLSHAWLRRHTTPRPAALVPPPLTTLPPPHPASARSSLGPSDSSVA